MALMACRPHKRVRLLRLKRSVFCFSVAVVGSEFSWKVFSQATKSLLSWVLTYGDETRVCKKHFQLYRRARLVNPLVIKPIAYNFTAAKKAPVVLQIVCARMISPLKMLSLVCLVWHEL